MSDMQYAPLVSGPIGRPGEKALAGTYTPARSESTSEA